MSAPIPADQVHAPASAARPSRARVPVASSLSALESVPIPAWTALAARAIEPNACYLPSWAIPVSRHARGRSGALALTAFDRAAPDRLTGLMPVRWARRALSLPVPLLVSWNAYAPFAAPLLDRDCAIDAASALPASASSLPAGHFTPSPCAASGLGMM